MLSSVPKAHRNSLSAGEPVVIRREVWTAALHVEMEMRAGALSRVSAPPYSLTLPYLVACSDQCPSPRKMEIPGNRTVLVAYEDEVFLQVLAIMIREVVPGSHDDSRACGHNRSADRHPKVNRIQPHPVVAGAIMTRCPPYLELCAW